MFLINGEPMSQKEHPKEYEWLQKKIKEIKAMGKKSFEYSAFDRRHKILLEDGRSIYQKDKRRIVSLIGSTDEPTGIWQTWAYASSMGATKEDGIGGRKLIRSTMQMKYEEMLDVEKDIELIVFFNFISNNRRVRKIDRQADAKKIADRVALRSRAESLIYHEDSPIHPAKAGNDLQLKNIALSWGVSNAISLDTYTLMSQLWDKIVRSQQYYTKTKRGYKEFIDQVNNITAGDKRSSIVLAIKNDILVYEGYVWKMVTKGGSEQYLCSVPLADNDMRDEYVISYLIANPKLYLTMTSLLEDVVKQLRSDGLYDDTKAMDRFELLKIAKEDLGWSGSHYKQVAKMNKEELLTLVAEKRRPEKLKVDE